MNANELADKLDEAADDLESEKIFAWEERAAATMLRQQQAEIETLKSGMEKLKDAYCERDNTVRQQQAQIEALKVEHENLKRAYLILSGSLSNVTGGGR